MRWIVFDEDTAEVLTGKYKRGATQLNYEEHPLDAALKLRRSFLILPSAHPERVLFASIELRASKASLKPRSPVVAQFTPLRNTPRQSSPSTDKSCASPGPAQQHHE